MLRLIDTAPNVVRGCQTGMYKRMKLGVPCGLGLAPGACPHHLPRSSLEVSGRMYRSVLEDAHYQVVFSMRVSLGLRLVRPRLFSMSGTTVYRRNWAKCHVAALLLVYCRLSSLLRHARRGTSSA